MRESTAKDWDWTDGTAGDWQAPGDYPDTSTPDNELPQIEDAAELISKPISCRTMSLKALVIAAERWYSAARANRTKRGY